MNLNDGWLPVAPDASELMADSVLHMLASNLSEYDITLCKSYPAFPTATRPLYCDSSSRLALWRAVALNIQPKPSTAAGPIDQDNQGFRRIATAKLMSAIAEKKEAGN